MNSQRPSHTSQDLWSSVVPILKKNDVREVALDDSLICMVGEENIGALVTGHHRATDVSCTMRYLAKFLTLFQEHFPATKGLEDCLNLSFGDIIVRIVKFQVQYDPQTVQFAKPTVAKALALQRQQEFLVPLKLRQ